MPTDAEYYQYECVQHYNPADHDHGNGHILIEPGDKLEVCSVHNPALVGSLENPQGWLKGRNVTKGLQGLFPGFAYVHFIKRDFNDSGYEGTPHSMYED